jgi:alkylation response protein AidB-like acyl-CoA dehydrogenase
VTGFDDVGSGFSELHGELRQVARDLLKNPAPGWGVLAASGWTGLEVPDDLDGAGATFAETAVILREMGRGATRAPYLGAAVLGVGTLLALEPGASRDGLLRQVATGEAIPVAVLGDCAPPGTGPGGAAAAGARDTGSFWLDGPRVRGQAGFIADAAAATRLLVMARDADGTPVIVDIAPGAAGLSVGPQPVVDETRGLAVVSADGAEGTVLRFAGDPEAAVGRLLDRAAVAIACDSLGLMEEALDRTVAYAKVRQQFGRPIGSFQAVQHACADMLVQVSVCRELVDAAVSAVAGGSPDAWVPAAMAKSHVTAAAVGVAGQAMQLHGGIGYTWESGLHAYLKRATLNRALFGPPSAHRRRLASRYGARYTNE